MTTTTQQAQKIEPGPNDRTFDLYGRSKYDSERTEEDYRVASLTTYGRNWSNEGRAERSRRYFLPEHLGFSDYSGCMVERANVKAFAEMFATGEDVWWFRAIGGHGTEAIVVDSHMVPDDVLTEVTETLGALTEYPCIDEELVSEMETEAEGPAWESWVRSDFTRALAEYVSWLEWPRDAISDVDDGKLREAFETVRERANEYWRIETGGGAWVDVERVAAEFSEDEIRALLA